MDSQSAATQPAESTFGQVELTGVIQAEQTHGADNPPPDEPP
jgi:hypothetical protein